METFLPMDFGLVDMITKYMKDELQKIETELKECSGSIDCSKVEPAGFSIKGNETGTLKAETELLKLVENVLVHGHDIERPEIPAFFHCWRGKEALLGIQVNRKVSIQLVDVKSRAESQAVAGIGWERRRLEVIPGKCLILTQGDITNCSVDAIVNPTNEDLKHMYHGGFCENCHGRSVSLLY